MVGTVGVAEERVVALVSVRRDKSLWTRWLMLRGSQWQRSKVLQKRERNGATTT